VSGENRWLSRRAHGLVSYRVSLVVAIPLLVVLTGGLITGNAYLATRESVRRLAASLFSQVADQTGERASAHVAQAPPAVDLLAALFTADEGTPAVDEAARRLLAVMRANAGFTWATFSQPDGSYVGVHRDWTGTLVVNDSHIENGKTHLVERTVESDSVWTPLRTDDDDHYDPRVRPFYVRATTAKKRAWVEPYIFFHEKVPGVTCSAPIYARDGSLRGVVGVDFDLNILSDFVTKLRASEHARVFVYTADGTILAHPTLWIERHKGQVGSGKLVTKDNIADDVVRAYFAAGDASSFTFGGERYLAATRPFEPDRGLSWRVGAVAPERDFMGGVDETTRFSLLVSLAAVALAVTLSAMLAARIAAPLAHLSFQMDKVGRFELDDEAPPPSIFREIALMYRALATMKSGLRSFASYVPRELVRAMLKSGEHAALGGRTRYLTVFFSDLAGFTSLSEKMAPSELVGLLSVYFDEMTRIIGLHGGTVDKFIGDGIMAFWNAPGDDPDHAAHACLAALECTRRLAALKSADKSLAPLSARIGIATGEVLVGNIGSHERLNYTVMGDTVNLASRLEGLNKVYGTDVLVSDATFADAKARVAMRAVDVVAVKGRERGARVYSPTGAADDSGAVARGRLAERALDAYVARRFEEARDLYAEMIALAPGDVAAATMKSRAEAFHTAPPPAGWAGVLVMNEK